MWYLNLGTIYSDNLFGAYLPLVRCNARQFSLEGLSHVKVHDLCGGYGGGLDVEVSANLFDVHHWCGGQGHLPLHNIHPFAQSHQNMIRTQVLLGHLLSNIAIFFIITNIDKMPKQCRC